MPMEWLDDLPIERRKQKMEENDIRSIAEALGDGWKLLATALGVMATKVDQQRDHDTVYWCFKVLNKWRQKNGHAATFGVMGKAIQSVLNSVNVDIDEIEKVIKGPYADVQPQGQLQCDGQPQGQLQCDGQPQGQFSADVQPQGQLQCDGQPQGQLRADAQPQGQLQADAQPQGQLKGDVQPQGQLQCDGQPQGQLRADAQPQGQLRADAQPQGQLQADAQPQGQLKGGAQPQGQIKGDAQPQGQLCADVQPQGQLRADVQHQGQLLADAQPQGQLQADAQPQGQLQGDAQPQGQLRADAQPQGQLRADAKLQADAQPQGQLQGDAQPQGQLRADAQPQGQLCADAQPQADNKLHADAHPQDKAQGQASPHHDYKNTYILLVASTGTPDEIDIFNDDMEKMKKMFEDKKIYHGIKSENIYTVQANNLNANEMREKIITKIGSIAEKMKRKSDEKTFFIFYYSGHCFIRSSDLKMAIKLGGSDATDMSEEELENQFSSIDATYMLFILDTCYSGGVDIGAKGNTPPTRQYPILFDLKHKYRAKGNSTQIAMQWCSSRDYQKSFYEKDESLFTSALVNAASGGKDSKIQETISTDAKVVTLRQIHSCVQDSFKKLKPMQEPVLIPDHNDKKMEVFPPFCNKTW